MNSATAIRKRLLTPANGRHSDETEIVPPVVWLREAEKKSDARYRLDREARRRRAEVAAAVEAAHLRDMEFAQEIERSVVSVKRILDAVSQHYRISVVEMLSGRRQADLVTARQVVMYLARKHTMRSYPQIGQVLGRRDHTTVLWGVSKIEGRLEREPRLVADIEAIRAKLQLVAPRVLDQGGHAET